MEAKPTIGAGEATRPISTGRAARSPTEGLTQTCSTKVSAPTRPEAGHSLSTGTRKIAHAEAACFAEAYAHVDFPPSDFATQVTIESIKKRITKTKLAAYTEIKTRFGWVRL